MHMFMHNNVNYNTPNNIRHIIYAPVVTISFFQKIGSRDEEHLRERLKIFYPEDVTSE